MPPKCLKNREKSMIFAILFRILPVVVAVLIVMLVMIKPNKKRDTSYFQAKMYAHRGLHGNGVPENSITAFKLARQKGFGVELDVQMTKDKKLVVFHDGTLLRMCGADGFLRDYTYEELQSFSLKGTDEKIPLFEEVLKVLGNTDLICEIKGDNGNKCYELCEKTYEALCKYEGRFCVESFSPFLVEWFRKNHPEIIRGQLSCNFYREINNMKWYEKFTMTHLLVNICSRPDFIAYKHQDVDAFGYKLCKRVFRPCLIAWTAKGEEEQKKAWGGFDSVIFEQFLGER